MKQIIGILLILSSVTVLGIRIVKKIELKQNVSGYLKRAADANTINLANEELTKAIYYLEQNDLTTGYTSIFWRTPDEDLDFWYRNLKASQTELENLESESALEKTNVLIKLRETLVDAGKRTKVTVPNGLDVFPNNTLWMVLTLTCLTLSFVGMGLLISVYAKKEGK